MYAVGIRFTASGLDKLIQCIVAVSGFRHDFLITVEAGGFGVIMDGENIPDRVIIVTQVL
ncbi:hypothetical protein HTQ63_12390 [Yersinia pestis subsp. pestis]|nr:hypothetical protein [Yersinia pestis subsp. pestis]NYV61659.1 hypothetical protein [Yersinia pestis]MBI0231235.1 hypothetical protein [Yersinia pestis subsp. pestis]MBI0261398.1 hypothetical protein [Yersinia pestis subsp. pestis]PCN66536.1 hypothetical protein A8V49_12770 [Yersinia pestis]